MTVSTKEKYINPFTDFGFKKLFGEEANKEVAALTSEEQDEYEESLKVYRDLKNVIDTAKVEGFAEGKLKGRLEGEKMAKIEMAKNCLLRNLDFNTISALTGLSIDEIKELKLSEQ
ncbi:MAG: hypothetical protein JXR48_10090 [Candidatus Delongbacteria bacterium]|nr:hypothetical protein [Candidatus Delongbacteria bacterium]MBN2835304.1 hypothetical protein [Candidatus Delongbacteria bacterium]